MKNTCQKQEEKHANGSQNGKSITNEKNQNHTNEHHHKNKKSKQKTQEIQENKEENDKAITNENEKNQTKEHKDDQFVNKKTKDKGNQDQKNEEKTPINKKQFDIHNRCKMMLSIVNNQDKNKLYTFHSSDETHELVNLRQQMANCINTTKFNKNIADPGPFKSNSIGDCKINICCTTAIECARRMHENKLNKIAVMSFANPHCPGGPYKKGVVTQETCIVSQTLLLGSLLNQSVRPFYSEKSKNTDLNNGLIYSPMVPVVTDNDGNFYNSDNIFYVDVISVSPIILPTKSHHKNEKHNHKHHNDSKYKVLQIEALPFMEKKIRDTIFVAASIKADGLILGAFGCGSVGNDPGVISEIFHKILIEDGYAGHFKQIDFAIIGKVAANAFHTCFKNYLQNKDQVIQPPEYAKDEEESIQESSASSDDNDSNHNSDGDIDVDKTSKNDETNKNQNDDSDEPDIC